MTTREAVVFLGPTLEVADARRLLDATYLPPVAQGDVLQLLDRPPAAIGIIDGYFELVPSVWHKEILLALARGTRVFGAASMGALRAAELASFGMEGVGTIFGWYRDGSLADDDEVAVAHGPAETGFLALSVAMVDVRDACRRAVDDGIVSPATAATVTAAAKAMYYADRNWPAISAAAVGVDPGELQALSSFGAVVQASGEGLKARDARALLSRLADYLRRPWPPSVAPVTPEPSVYLANLQAEVRAGVGREVAGPDPIETLSVRLGEPSAVARKKVLLRLLIRQEADALAIGVSEEDLQAESDAFRRQFGLLTRADFLAWFGAEGLTDAAWREYLRDRCLAERLDDHYDAEIRAGLASHLRLATARLWHDVPDQPAPPSP